MADPKERQMTDTNAALIKALLSGEQADADGVMVNVSRQACEEAAAALSRQPAGEPVAWSTIRSILEQGAAIQQDYVAGKYANYEEYSARLDAAARERVPPALPDGMVPVKRENLAALEFASNGYCPACAGWNVEKGRGCKPKVHTKDCWLAAAKEEGK